MDIAPKKSRAAKSERRQKEREEGKPRICDKKLQSKEQKWLKKKAKMFLLFT